MADPKKAAAQAQSVALNAALGEVNKLVESLVDRPEMQMGVLALAQALAFRRVLASANVTNRGQRYKLMRLATEDFETKLRQFALNYVDPVEDTNPDSPPAPGGAPG